MSHWCYVLASPILVEVVASNVSGPHGNICHSTAVSEGAQTLGLPSLGEALQ